MFEKRLYMYMYVYTRNVMVIPNYLKTARTKSYSVGLVVSQKITEPSHL